MVTSIAVPYSFFILASSVGKSLQCPISTLTQVVEGGHLFRLTCSVVLWGGRSTAKKITLACVGSACSVWTTLGLPPLTGTFAFWVYTAQAPGCSEEELSKAVPGFPALPRSKLLRFRFWSAPQGHRLGWACISCASQVWAAQATKCLVSALSQVSCLNHLPSPGGRLPWGTARALSQVCCVSALRSWSQGETFLADVNHLGSQEDVVSNKEPAHSLVEDAGLWGWDCPLPSDSGCRPLASLPPAGRRDLYTAG